MRLAKEGYFGGDPSKVMEADCDMVLDCIRYEGELIKYADCHAAINREGGL